MTFETERNKDKQIMRRQTTRGLNDLGKQKQRKHRETKKKTKENGSRFQFKNLRGSDLHFACLLKGHADRAMNAKRSPICQSP